MRWVTKERRVSARFKGKKGAERFGEALYIAFANVWPCREWQRGTVLPLYRLILRTEISVMQGQAGSSRARDFRGLVGPADSLMKISDNLGATSREHPRPAVNKSDQPALRVNSRVPRDGRSSSRASAARIVTARSFRRSWQIKADVGSGVLLFGCG